MSEKLDVLLNYESNMQQVVQEDNRALKKIETQIKNNNEWIAKREAIEGKLTKRQEEGIVKRQKENALLKTQADNIRRIYDHQSRVSKVLNSQVGSTQQLVGIEKQLVQQNKALQQVLEGIHKTNLKIESQKKRAAASEEQRLSKAERRMKAQTTFFGAFNTEFSSSFSHKVGTTAQYIAAGAGIMTVAQAFKTLGENIVESDYNLRTMAAVLDMSLSSANALSQSIHGLGTVYGGTIKEIEQVSLALGRAGVSQDQLVSSTEVVLQMARLTGDTFEQSTSAIISFQQVFGDTASVELLGDKLAYVANVSRLSTQDIGTFSNYALAAAKNVGLTVDAVGGLAAAFSNAGVNASTIGTQIRRFTTLLTDNSTAVNNFFQGLGVNQQNLLYDLQKGGAESNAALIEFVNTLKSVDNVRFTNLIGGMDILAANSLQLMRNNSENVTRFVKDLETGVEGQLASTKVILDSYRVSLETTWNKILNGFNKFTNDLSTAMSNVSLETEIKRLEAELSSLEKQSTKSGGLYAALFGEIDFKSQISEVKKELEIKRAIRDLNVNQIAQETVKQRIVKASGEDQAKYLQQLINLKVEEDRLNEIANRGIEKKSKLTESDYKNQLTYLEGTKKELEDQLQVLKDLGVTGGEGWDKISDRLSIVNNLMIEAQSHIKGIGDSIQSLPSFKGIDISEQFKSIKRGLENDILPDKDTLGLFVTSVEYASKKAKEAVFKQFEDLGESLNDTKISATLQAEFSKGIPALNKYIKSQIDGLDNIKDKSGELYKQESERVSKLVNVGNVINGIQEKNIANEDYLKEVNQSILDTKIKLNEKEADKQKQLLQIRALEEAGSDIDNLKIEILRVELEAEAKKYDILAEGEEKRKSMLIILEKSLEMLKLTTKQEDDKNKILDKQNKNYDIYQKKIEDEIKGYLDIKTYKSDALALQVRNLKVSEQQREQLQRMIVQLKKYEKAHEGINGAILEYNQKLGFTEDKLKDITNDALKNLEDGFMDFFDNSSDAFLDFGDLAEGVLNDIYKQILRIGVVQPLTGGIASLFGGAGVQSATVDATKLVSQGFTEVAGNFVKEIAGQTVSISSTGQVLSGGDALSSSGIGDLVGLASNANTAYNIFTNPTGWADSLLGYGTSIGTSLGLISASTVPTISATALAGYGTTPITAGFLNGSGTSLTAQYFGTQTGTVQGLAGAGSTSYAITPLGYGALGALGGGVLGFGMDKLLGADTYAGYTGMAGGAIGGYIGAGASVGGPWGAVIGAVLGSVVGGIFGKKKFVEAGLQVFEDAYSGNITNEVIQQYEIWKKKSWFSSKTSYFNNELSARELAQIESMFSTVDQIVNILGGIGDLRVAAGRYSQTSLSDSLLPQYIIGEAIGYDLGTLTPEYFDKATSITDGITEVMYRWKQALDEFTSDVSYEDWVNSNSLDELSLQRNAMIDHINLFLDDWKMVAEEMETSVIELLTTTASAFQDTTREFDLYNADTDLQRLLLTADYAKFDLEQLASSVGTDAATLTVENFIDKYEEAIQGNFTKSTFDSWEQLGDYLMASTEATRAYNDALEAQRQALLESVNAINSSYATLYSQIEDLRNPKTYSLLNFGFTDSTTFKLPDIVDTTNFNNVLNGLQVAYSNSMSQYTTQMAALEAELLNAQAEESRAQAEAASNRQQSVVDSLKDSVDTLDSTIKDLTKVQEILLDTYNSIILGASPVAQQFTKDQYNILYDKIRQGLIDGTDVTDYVSDFSNYAKSYANYIQDEAVNRDDYLRQTLTLANEVKALSGTGRLATLNDLNDQLDDLNDQLSSAENTLNSINSSVNAVGTRSTGEIIASMNALKEKFGENGDSITNVFKEYLDRLEELLKISQASAVNDVVNSDTNGLIGDSTAVNVGTGLTDLQQYIYDTYKGVLGWSLDLSNSNQQAGLDYWVNELTSGKLNTSNMSQAIATAQIAGSIDSAGNLLYTQMDEFYDYAKNAYNYLSNNGFQNVLDQYNVKPFADGGIVTGPTLGLIGEAGYNEAVIPLDGRDALGISILRDELRGVRRDIEELIYVTTMQAKHIRSIDKRDERIYIGGL